MPVADPNADQTAFWNAGPGENWARYQTDLDLMHMSVLAELMQRCAIGPGETLLDIGCGAGATTLVAARAAGPGGQARGVDISVPLLRLAEQRRISEGIHNAEFELADAQTCTFDAARYDLAMSRFGLMFFSDPVAAFRNIGAALRPGGRLVFACWAGPEHNPWFTLPERIAVARLGPVPASDPVAPGPMAFRDVARVCRILQEAGLSDVQGDLQRLDLHHPGGVPAVLQLALHVGPTARLLREKNGSDEDRASISGTLDQMLQGFASADGIRIPAGVIFYSARRL